MNELAVLEQKTNGKEHGKIIRLKILRFLKYQGQQFKYTYNIGMMEITGRSEYFVNSGENK